jgi:hypothetical protein
LRPPENGKANQFTPDEDVFAFARQQEWILLTLNRKHFIRLTKTNLEQRSSICEYKRGIRDPGDSLGSFCAD